MLYLQPIKTLLLSLLFSFSSVSYANSYKDYYSLDAPENTALFVAIATGDFKKAETLLEAGVNPNAKSVNGATAIHALTLNDDEQGSIEFLPTLIKYGADINAQDVSGGTGLGVAIFSGRYQLSQTLAQNKETDINRQNKEGHTALHCVVVLNCGNIELQLLTVLVSRPDINVNAESDGGVVPILFPLTFIFSGLYKALYLEEGILPNSEQIYKAGQAVQIFLKSPHKVDLTIKNIKDISPYDVLSALKEHLPKLPKDSNLYSAFEPIRDILSSGKYTSYTQ